MPLCLHGWRRTIARQKASWTKTLCCKGLSSLKYISERRLTNGVSGTVDGAISVGVSGLNICMAAWFGCERCNRVWDGIPKLFEGQGCETRKRSGWTAALSSSPLDGPALPWAHLSLRQPWHHVQRHRSIDILRHHPAVFIPFPCPYHPSIEHLLLEGSVPVNMAGVCGRFRTAVEHGA